MKSATRIERVNRTVQGRLITELDTARITTVEAANAYLTERFLPDYDAEFAHPPASPDRSLVKPGRDINEPSDLPITKGLPESIHEFRKIDEEIDLKSIRPGLQRRDGKRLPGVAGGLSVALARTFTIIDPDLKNPQTEHWKRASVSSISCYRRRVWKARPVRPSLAIAPARAGSRTPYTLPER